MPELQNTFQAGKMNKDVDERLISSGEYRDALNIEITTSEGSNIGTAQTILGNRQMTSVIGNSNLNDFTTIHHTVGHLVDEKKDRIFRLVATPAEENNGVGVDRVMEYNTDVTVQQTEIPVAVDVYRSESIVNIASYQTSNPNDTIDLNTNCDYIRPGMQIKAETSTGAAIPTWTYADEIYVATVNYTSDTAATITLVHTNKVAFSNVTAISPTDKIYFKAPRVLKFDMPDVSYIGVPDKVSITGINLIDDLLFWTDNYSEPKKIHIPRSKEGTKGDWTNDVNVTGSASRIAHKTHTRLIVKNQGLPTGLEDIDYITEDHITVIRKSPTLPPTIESWNTPNISASTEFPEIVSCQTNILFGTYYNGANISMIVGDTFTWIESGANLTNFAVNDRLLFTHTYEHPGSGEWVVAEVYATITIASGGGSYTCVIDSMTQNQPMEPDFPTSANYFIYEVELQQKNPMWEFKFPRFAYRYKYSDGEYSCFGPFTNVIFVPSQFDYAPKKGYNLGMVNDLRYLEINDWVPKDIPKDVVQVDIVYKETSSPNVYTIESFKPNDPIPPLAVANPWNTQGNIPNITPPYSSKHKGSYRISTDLIHKTIPSNQLLRPWDNVPRITMAQEMSGNRLIYANYIQNYNLEDANDQDIGNPGFKVNFYDAGSVVDSGLPGKSLKSMRNYQLGVVYRDEHGRETPVLTSQSGALRLPKSKAHKYNRFRVELTTPPPAWAKTYKFFIKETSNEYYNLAMDRYYSAKDGNIWLSFPSSERNKISEDSFIILKKEHDSSRNVSDQDARYKIIAIENSAPDFIKTENLPWGSISPYPSFTDSGAPYPGRQNIDIDLTQWDASAFGNLDAIQSAGLQVQVRTPTNYYQSDWYDVTNIGNVDLGPKEVKRLTCKTVFGEDMLFTSNDGGTTMIDNLVLEVRQKKVVNRAQFDGRFFVKIYKDAILVDKLITSANQNIENLIPSITKRISYMDYCSPGYNNGGMYDKWLFYDGNHLPSGNTFHSWGNGHLDACIPDQVGNRTRNKLVPWISPYNDTGAWYSAHANYAACYSVPKQESIRVASDAVTYAGLTSTAGWDKCFISDVLTYRRPPRNHNCSFAHSSLTGITSWQGTTIDNALLGTASTGWNGNWEDGLSTPSLHYEDKYHRNNSDYVSDGDTLLPTDQSNKKRNYIAQQPLTVPRGSRWNSHRHENSPGPYGGDWTDYRPTIGGIPMDAVPDPAGSYFNGAGVTVPCWPRRYRNYVNYSPNAGEPASFQQNAMTTYPAGTVGDGTSTAPTNLEKAMWPGDTAWYWRPGIKTLGPWGGNGSSHVRGTYDSKFSTYWLSNTNGSQLSWVNQTIGPDFNPVGGMLAKYHHGNQLHYYHGDLDYPNNTCGPQAGATKYAYSAHAANETKWIITNSKVDSQQNISTNSDDMGTSYQKINAENEDWIFGTSYPPYHRHAVPYAWGVYFYRFFIGLGTFGGMKSGNKPNIQGSKQWNTGSNFFKDLDGNIAFNENFEDEIFGRTGFYGLDYLRHQWSHSSDPTDLYSYRLPYTAMNLGSVATGEWQQLVDLDWHSGDHSHTISSTSQAAIPGQKGVWVFKGEFANWDYSDGSALNSSDPYGLNQHVHSEFNYWGRNTGGSGDQPKENYYNKEWNPLYNLVTGGRVKRGSSYNYPIPQFASLGDTGPYGNHSGVYNIEETSNALGYVSPISPLNPSGLAWSCGWIPGGRGPANTDLPSRNFWFPPGAVNQTNGETGVGIGGKMWPCNVKRIDDCANWPAAGGVGGGGLGGNYSVLKDVEVPTGNDGWAHSIGHDGLSSIKAWHLYYDNGHLIPEPNTEVPFVFNESQYPLCFPRKSEVHAKKGWWDDWWDGKSDFGTLLKRSRLNPYGELESPRLDPARRWIIDRIGAAQDKAGAGIFKDGLTNNQFMDISYIGIGTGVKGNTIWSLAETPSELGFADALNTPGTRFRFKEDHNETVYTIVNSWLNTDGEPSYIDPDTGDAVEAPAEWRENPEILNFENNPDHVDYDLRHNRRIRWRIQLDKEIGSSANAEAPYYHPILNALNPNLVDTNGTHLTNPGYNPFGRTTGSIGEPFARVKVTTDTDNTAQHIITLDALEPYLVPGLTLTTFDITTGACTAINPDDITVQNPNPTETSVTEAFGITVISVEDVGGKTVVELSSAITTNGAGATVATDLVFAVAAKDIKCYEFPHAGLPPHGDDGSGNVTTSLGNPCMDEEYTHIETARSGSAKTGELAAWWSSTPPAPAAGEAEIGRMYWDSGWQAYTSNNRWDRGDWTETSANPGGFTASAGNFGGTWNSGTNSYGSTARTGKCGLNEWGLNYQTIEILETFDTGSNESDLPMSANPAIWETEPREDIGMDIYYEASEAFPINLIGDSSEDLIRVGMIVVINGTPRYITSVAGNIITINTVGITAIAGDTVAIQSSNVNQLGVVGGDKYMFLYTVKNAVLAGDITIELVENIHNEQKDLKYFNCYSFANGVESNRVRDDYNAVTIDKGVKASMPMATPYEEERRSSGLIFSGIYNSTSGVNTTNQFIQAEPITKDLNPVYGEIKKLFSRDSDLVTFCEDQVFKILANKDALFEAGGNQQLTANNRVLGQAIPFSGEFGMSHRESFAAESYRSYFVDSNRGAVIRLSRDGMTPISAHGMKDYFFDNLKSYTKIVGSFDDRKGTYNLSLQDSWTNPDVTLSFTEDTRGWVSFKSFIPERGCGFNNTYFTFNNGQIWRHHDETSFNILGTSQDQSTWPIVGAGVASDYIIQLASIAPELIVGMNIIGDGIKDGCVVTSIIGGANNEIQISNLAAVATNTTLTFSHPRNNFYNVQYDSSIITIFNGGPEVVKGFSLLKYEGSQAKITESKPNSMGVSLETSTGTAQAGSSGVGQYYNNIEKYGWYVNSIKTDLQTGNALEFKNKEGKWFNYIHGEKRDIQAECKNWLEGEPNAGYPWEWDTTKCSFTTNLDTREFSLQGIDYACDINYMMNRWCECHASSATPEWDAWWDTGDPDWINHCWEVTPYNPTADALYLNVSVVKEDSQGQVNPNTGNIYKPTYYGKHNSSNNQGFSVYPESCNSCYHIPYRTLEDPPASTAAGTITLNSERKFIIEPEPGFYIAAKDQYIPDGTSFDGGKTWVDAKNGGSSTWTWWGNGNIGFIEREDTTTPYAADNKVIITVKFDPTFAINTGQQIDDAEVVIDILVFEKPAIVNLNLWLL